MAAKKALVIVESPAKARTISKFLGSDYHVEASMGHIRDLPSTAAEVPEKYQGKPWARLAVDVEDGFKPIYIVPPEKREHVRKLRGLAAEARELYLATDEDREGEAIAWHLLQELRPKVPVKRMVFHEITQTAIRSALEHTRQLNEPLVDAQEARRILDRLYGYEVSPVLWRKVQSGLSAGRVQSVAVRLVVDRERQRMAFVRAGYWDVEAQLAATGSEGRAMVEARLAELDGRRVASGRDFDPATGKLIGDAVLLDETRARRVAATLQGRDVVVDQVTEKPFTQRPYPPFITSTLQQEAARKLRLSAKATMGLAQQLYENGYITYMRTDSTTLSQQALDAARRLVGERYGAAYLPPEPRLYNKKVKGAQEAHEAIRPAGEVFRTPEELASELTPDQLRLYDLIWKRTVASQMKDAQGQRTTVQLRGDAGADGIARLTASGKVLTFPGFLRAYVEGSDDPEADLEDQERVLPPLRTGQSLLAESLTPKGHETQPPARFTEASLIKELEDRGIGRPSTFANILQTIIDRGYVFKKGTALPPTFLGFAVTQLMEGPFDQLVDYDFTANMEKELDEIAGGERQAAPWLSAFYYGGGSADGRSLRDRIARGQEIDPRPVCTVPLQASHDGKPVVVRVGKYGPFLTTGDDGLRANVPPGLAPDELTAEKVAELINLAAKPDRVVGVDPATGKNIYARNGRFGPYVQLGEMEELPAGKKRKADAPRPRMASLWPGMALETLTTEEAQQILSFPKVLGRHPETGDDVVAQDGKFGPYIQSGKESRSLADHAQLAIVTLEKALELLAQPRQGRARSAAAQKALAEPGNHPRSGAPLKVMNGRFGAYVTDGVVNASLPKGADPASMTIEQLVDLLDAREAKLREQGVDPRAPKTKGAKGARRATTTRKTAAAKTAKVPKAAVEGAPAKRKAAATRRGAAS